MISLPDPETPTYRVTEVYHACNVCGALVHACHLHTEYHADLVAWLRALRDGKVDG